MVKLDKKGFRATGTVRENTLQKCTITSTTELNKKPRGSFDFRSHGNIEVVRWNDNSAVTLCSNSEGVEPVGEVKRRVKGRGVLDVQQPYVVRSYNSGMGGVDLVDRSLSELIPKIKGKKWYWTLLINAFNLGLVFSWRIFRLAHTSSISQKDFRLNLAHVMIKYQGKSTGRPGPSYSEPKRVRCDNVNHRPILNQVRRCMVCKKIAKFNAPSAGNLFT